MTDAETRPKLTSLARGGGCGCKLDPAFLDTLLDGGAPAILPPELLVDAARRDDAAVWRVDDETCLVATTDFFAPVVDDPFEFGRIAATNALSDVYAMGARPIFCLALLGMPIDTVPPDDIRRILEGGKSVAAEAGAPVAGGHSIDSAEPFYGLVALGLAKPDQIRTNAMARPGDRLILGKPLGIGVYSAAMKRGLLSDTDYAEMIASTTRLNRPGPDLAALDGVRAMTDVTGFGILGHLKEVCAASGVSARIEQTALPVFEGARALAENGVKTGASTRNWAAVSDAVDLPEELPDAQRALLTDPQTSGGLLVSVAPDAVEDALAVFHRHGHDAARVIGETGAGAPRIQVV